MSDALNELFASAPVGVMYYATLEFRHSAFDPATIRLVQGFDDIVATLEPGAPVNPSTAVTFTAAAFSVRTPTKGVEGEYDMQLVIDAADGEITRQLELQAAANREPIKVRFREFISSDLSEPQSTAIEMTLINPKVDKNRVTARAVFADVVNKAFPSINYTLTTHPGLA